MAHEPKLYHEKQVAALCGVHCLNTLLQGPVFTEVELAQIAHELDALEKQFMLESGVDSESYRQFLAEESGNVSQEGNFSIQVLSKALHVWNLDVISLDNPVVKGVEAEPQHEEAFICNLQEHWFTIRRMGDDWWNFNSLLTAPAFLSTFYLSAYLGTLKDQGYTIFLVRGQFPKLQYDQIDQGNGRWLTPTQAKALTQESQAAQQRGRVANALETALARAAQQGGQLTLRPRGQADSAAADEDLAAALAASLAEHQGTSAGAASGGGVPMMDVDMDEDPELAAAIAASLAEANGGSAAGGSGGGGGAAWPPTEVGSALTAEQRQLAASLAFGLAQAQRPAPTPPRPAAAAVPSASQSSQHAQHGRTAAQSTSSSSLVGGAQPAAAITSTATSAHTPPPHPPAAASTATQVAPGAPSPTTTTTPGPPLAASAPHVTTPASSAPPSTSAPGGSGEVELAFRLPSGARVSERFSAAAPVSLLYQYLQSSHQLDPATHLLACSYPRKALSDPSQTLAEAGLTCAQLINVELRR